MVGGCAVSLSLTVIGHGLRGDWPLPVRIQIGEYSGEFHRKRGESIQRTSPCKTHRVYIRRALQEELVFVAIDLPVRYTLHRYGISHSEEVLPVSRTLHRYAAQWTLSMQTRKENQTRLV